MRRLLCCALVVGALGCSKSAPPAGKLVTAAQVCSEADGSRVRLTGTLRYRRGLLSFCSNYGGHKTCDLALYADAAAPPDFNVMRPQTGPEPLNTRLSVPVGGQPGEMEDLPEKFQASDVKLHLPNGATASEGSRVTVDGKLSVIPKDPTKPNEPAACYVNVEWAAP